MKRFDSWKQKIGQRWAERPNWRDMATGDWMAQNVLFRNMRFFLLLFVLSMLMVHNRYAHEAELRKIELLNKELTDVKNRSLTISKELMQMSRQSYVMEKLRERGSTLQLSYEPATVVE